jgi:hypothetical protein
MFRIAAVADVVPPLAYPSLHVFLIRSSTWEGVIGEYVDVRRTSALKLQEPQVRCTHSPPAPRLQESAQMAFDRATIVRIVPGVGECDECSELDGGIVGDKRKPPPTLLAKLGDLAPRAIGGWWCVPVASYYGVSLVKVYGDYIPDGVIHCATSGKVKRYVALDKPYLRAPSHILDGHSSPGDAIWQVL